MGNGLNTKNAHYTLEKDLEMEFDSLCSAPSEKRFPAMTINSGAVERNG